MTRKSRGMQSQILEMFEAGHSLRKITESLKISRNTVRRYVRKAADADQLTTETSVKDQTLLPDWLRRLDVDYLVAEIRSGRSFKSLFEECSPAVCYEHFTRHLGKLAIVPPKASPRFNFTPGERTQVDYADGIEITDRRSGVKTKTELFCGVLPFSSYCFGEFTWSQKQEDFLRSHERMWRYYGGVTPYVVIDNLKSGVTRAHRYDPDINPTYCDFGNFWGFAVLAARPREPRDKACVESTIGAIQRDFYQRCRERTFYSLDELNTSFREYLAEFNSRTMKDYGVSRLDRFSKEKGFLQPLVHASYEVTRWREAKVHPDCCIQLEKAFYSVPFNYVGQTVKVKYSEKTVHIMSSSLDQIAVHPVVEKYQKSVIDEHFPPHAVQVRSFDLQKARALAKAIGPMTLKYVDWQFDETDRPLNVLRRVQGIVRLSSKPINPQAMEYAAKQAMQFGRKELRYFKHCAESYSVTAGILRQVKVPTRDPQTLNLQGE